MPNEDLTPDPAPAEHDSDIDILAEGGDDNPPDPPRDADEGEDEGSDKGEGSEEETEETPEPKKKEEVEEEDEDEEAEDSEEHVSNRPTLKAVTAKFPTLLKEFPELRHMYFREAEFTKVFPTVADAKEASDKSYAMDMIEVAVAEGDVGTILNNIHKGTGEETLKQFVHNFLPSVQKGSKELYAEITEPVVQNVLRFCLAEGIRGGDSKDAQRLAAASKILSKYLFGSENIPDAPKPDPKVEAERNRLKQERQAESQKKYKEASGKLFSKAGKIMLKEIGSAIDPEHKLSPTMKQMITGRIMAEISETLDKDEGHTSHMRALWDRFIRSGYDEKLGSRLLSAYLGRARSLAPRIRNRVVSEVLNKPAPKETKKHIPAGGDGTGKSTSKTPDARNVDWSKTSDKDFLNDRIALKR